MFFNRFDICEAYWLYYCLWHMSGLTRRDLKHSRSIARQLSAMNYLPSLIQTFDASNENVAAIYDNLVRKWEGKEPQGSLTMPPTDAIL